MNKIKYILLFAAVVFLTSCDMKEKFEVEKPKVVELAGEWYVQYNHSEFGEDPFGVGVTSLITYNTSADDANLIWLSDQGNFWSFQVKIPCDVNSLTFGSTDTVINAVSGYPIKVVVQNGKIIKGVSEQPSGIMADSIYFEVWYEDLEDATGIPQDKMLVSGFRRTAFLEDEPH